MTYNLADLFESIADAVPQREAVITADRRLTYQQLEDRSNRLANALQAQGVGPGDHVGLQLRNGNEYIEGMLAAYKLRAIAINVNYNYVEGELRYLFDDADLKALVVHRQFASRVAAVQADLPMLQTVLHVDDGSASNIPDAWSEYEATLAGASAARACQSRSGDDRYIIYTGGTTGMPKGVIWRHEDIFFAAMGGGDLNGTQGPITSPETLVDRVLAQEHTMCALSTPPFMHAAAQWLAMNTLLAGGKLVIPAHGAFDTKEIWVAIGAEKVLMIVVVGDAMATPLADELEANPDAYDASSLFVIASGGALFSPSTKQRLLKLLPGRLIMDTLGSSETGTMGSKTSTEGQENADEPRFMVNEHMQVLDDDLQPVEPGSGQTGRLARKGRVPLGYHKAPDKSALTFVELDGERWSIPGDIAVVEEDGTILLRGRGSTSINTGGEKVFPEEVEAVLKSHEDIVDTVVVGVPDERWGQIVVAVCQTRSGKELALDALREFCRTRLAAYKLPRQAVFVEQIKRSPAGKADYPWAKDYATSVLQTE